MFCCCFYCRCRWWLERRCCFRRKNSTRTASSRPRDPAPTADAGTAKRAVTSPTVKTNSTALYVIIQCHRWCHHRLRWLRRRRHISGRSRVVHLRRRLLLLEHLHNAVWAALLMSSCQRRFHDHRYINHWLCLGITQLCRQGRPSHLPLPPLPHLTQTQPQQQQLQSSPPETQLMLLSNRMETVTKEKP